MPVLVHLRKHGSGNKYGVPLDELDDFLWQLCHFRYVHAQGIMASGIEAGDPAEVGVRVREIKADFDRLSELGILNLAIRYLSVDADTDYSVAVQAGANLIRVDIDRFLRNHTDVA